LVWVDLFGRDPNFLRIAKCTRNFVVSLGFELSALDMCKFKCTCKNQIPGQIPRLKKIFLSLSGEHFRNSCLDISHTGSLTTGICFGRAKLSLENRQLFLFGNFYFLLKELFHFVTSFSKLFLELLFVWNQTVE
jgi:hypothetical protein